MTRKQKRLTVIGAGVSFIIAAVLLIMFAFNESVAYFYLPADLATNPVPAGTRIRLGGLVGEGSVVRGNGTTVQFSVTDGTGQNVKVRYTGILPDLFREGQGVVTEGTFESGNHEFIADTVLAKHDEKYLPRDVAEKLKEQGLWQQVQADRPETRK
jgi:cytochrome c-type biogenesis protein CcmE